ncbi:putative monosaccharide-P-dolichol utilization protein [Aspergillus lucknowensis]|uniref:Mannose-P-dolichol utilization defect 1 protein homolog n=1 Tax=Aspergillus lucknowensis TaxID=176173 RepID=A0ABR4M2T9_9EURO
MDAIQKTLVDPLQPYLRPVVSSVPQPIHDAIISLVGPSCHNTLVVNLDLAQDPECTSLAISKALGIGIVGASGIVKVPQILKLIRSRSSAGVSFVSYALETASLLITLSYGVRNQFPFSTYGESAFIAAQDVMVGVLVLTYAGRSAAAAAFVAVVAASVYALLVDTTIVDAQTMAYLQAGAGALGIASKVPQILTIWQEGGTGQLSAFAVFNYLAGSLSRIFTTLQEVDDKLILYGFVAGFLLNLVLAAQMLYYWNSPVQGKKQPQKLPPKSKQTARKPVATPAATRTTGASPSPKPSGKTPTTRRRG